MPVQSIIKETGPSVDVLSSPINQRKEDLL